MAKKRVTTTFTADSTEALKIAEAGGSEDEVVQAFVDSVEINAPNIAYVGKAPWKPLKAVHSAHREVIRLPEDQSTPFYHEKAAYIINQFPLLYKRVVSKGAK